MIDLYEILVKPYRPKVLGSMEDKRRSKRYYHSRIRSIKRKRINFSQARPRGYRPARQVRGSILQGLTTRLPSRVLPSAVKVNCSTLCTKSFNVLSGCCEIASLQFLLSLGVMVLQLRQALHFMFNAAHMSDEVDAPDELPVRP